MAVSSLVKTLIAAHVVDIVLFSLPTMIVARSLRSFTSCRLSRRSISTLFNPTEDHVALRSMLRNFVEREVRCKGQRCGVANDNHIDVLDRSNRKPSTLTRQKL